MSDSASIAVDGVTKRFRLYHERNQTPSTPSIPQIQALDAQLDDILVEGLENRFARHAMLAEIVRDWARERFGLFAEEGFESVTVTCVENTRAISVADLNKELASQWAMISNGVKRCSMTSSFILVDVLRGQRQGVL